MDNIDISSQLTIMTVIGTIVCTSIVSFIFWRLIRRNSPDKINPFIFFFCVIMIGSFFYAMVKSYMEKDTVKVLMLEGNGSHHTAKIKDVFHPAHGEDVYPNDEKISGLTVLYNNSSEEMIHYSVSYYSQPPSYNRLGDYYGQGKIIKAGDYILVSSWDKPDYWFKVAPSSVTIKTSNKSKNTGTLKYIVDFVKNLEERGFVVDDFGTIRYKK